MLSIFSLNYVQGQASRGHFFEANQWYTIILDDAYDRL